MRKISKKKTRKEGTKRGRQYDKLETQKVNEKGRKKDTEQDIRINIQYTRFIFIKNKQSVKETKKQRK